MDGDLLRLLGDGFLRLLLVDRGDDRLLVLLVLNLLVDRRDQRLVRDGDAILARMFENDDDHTETTNSQTWRQIEPVFSRR